MVNIYAAGFFSLYRYLLMEVRFEDGMVDESLTTSTVYHDIMRSVDVTYGEYGHGCVKMSFKGTWPH